METKPDAGAASHALLTETAKRCGYNTWNW
jgi:hypothetical protein